MTQPTFVPIAEADQVRPARHLHVPAAWTAIRPAELSVPAVHRGAAMGTPGPDSGFALRLAKRFEHDLRLGDDEVEHDVLMGVALVAAKRAALFGRAPCVYDVRHALDLWGFLGDAPVGTPILAACRLLRRWPTTTWPNGPWSTRSPTSRCWRLRRSPSRRAVPAASDAAGEGS